ncbi:MAG: hypothetical protein HYZ75_04445 [Elusimicrobia bacterium]|nr:hypothetical protein [Elusimicrobiota bacterium]
MKTIRNETSLLRASRYVHRNPVEAGLVSKAEDWRWSSMGIYAGRRAGEFLDKEPILRAIGSGGTKAYCDFVEAAREPEPSDDWYSDDTWLFTGSVQKRASPDWRLRAGAIMDSIAVEFGLPQDLWRGDLRSKGLSDIRKAAAMRLRAELYLTVREIGEVIGVSAGTISRILAA